MAARLRRPVRAVDAVQANPIADVEDVRECAFGDQRALAGLIPNDHDAQPFADEIVRNLVDLVFDDSENLIARVGVDRDVEWVVEAGLEVRVEIARNAGPRPMARAVRSSAPSSRTTPSVSVPVLSVHITSMLPRFAMALSRRTMTPRPAIRCAPCASVMRQNRRQQFRCEPHGEREREQERIDQRFVEKHVHR